MMAHEHNRPGLPSPFLMNHAGLLPKGRVLDVAMGRGRNAIYLAGLGFEVEGVDISHEALNDAFASAKAAGVCIRIREMDLEKTGVSLGDVAFDGIICFNYLYRPLIPILKNALRPGGVMVYETYIVDQVKFGRPRNPKHLLKHNELLEFFRDFRVLQYREGIFEHRKAVAGIVCEKNQA